MIEYWRELLYPLGFLSSLLFGARGLIQWITSEIKQKSVVTPIFWKISLVGNLTLLIHSLIQMQYHVSLIQSCNAVISWRNLNLMQDKAGRASLKKVIIVMLASLMTTSFLFILQDYFFYEELGSNWFRIPKNPWQASLPVISDVWHFIGFLGLILFSSRFWIQWWYAEKEKTSYLGSQFWWTTLIGDTLTLAYFVRIADPVNFIGPVLGLIPYIRNLMLLNKEKTKKVKHSLP